MEEVGQASKQGFKLFDQMELQEYPDKLVIKSLNNNNSPPEISTASQLTVLMEKRDEAYFMSLLRTMESTPGLYYSYETDLTLKFRFCAVYRVKLRSMVFSSMSTNLQMNGKLAEGRARKPLWKQADPLFVWNRSLLEELIECKLDAFIVPLVQGSILKSITSYDSKYFVFHFSTSVVAINVGL
ncbi:hypothetical protein IFM89_011065 [Coptis chinensis]|uniref:SAC domain-containing protein n=1 Tax=Coptis chinensis TaxID=261450 RepID=A0A835IJX7_9MAGN|nr:hypothetical protein IFM89_011065 [Coptis chinensis]